MYLTISKDQVHHFHKTKASIKVKASHRLLVKVQTINCFLVRPWQPRKISIWHRHSIIHHNDRPLLIHIYRNQITDEKLQEIDQASKHRKVRWVNGRLEILLSFNHQRKSYYSYKGPILSIVRIYILILMRRMDNETVNFWQSFKNKMSLRLTQTTMHLQQSVKLSRIQVLPKVMLWRGQMQAK